MVELLMYMVHIQLRITIQRYRYRFLNKPGAFQFFQPNDVLVLDRCFRDCIKDQLNMEFQLKYQLVVYVIINIKFYFLFKHVNVYFLLGNPIDVLKKPLTSRESNESREATKVRFVVEGI